MDLAQIAAPIQPYLAQLPDPESPEAIGFLVIGIAALVGLISSTIKNVLDIAHSMRAKPGEFATKEDVSRLEGRLDASESEWREELRAIHRALGRIEGALETRS